MSHRRIGFLVAAILAFAMTAQAETPVRAAAYPAAAIRLVVAFTPGGPSDTLARIVGERLSAHLGQPVVIDNRPGAGGNIAADVVAKSPPDGYTLLMANNSILATNAALYGHLDFDPVTDFAPISLIGSQPNILVVNPAVPAHSVAELVAVAKERPGKLNYASSGAGTAAHLAGELFKLQAGIDIVHVPYRGAIPALTDLMGGRTDLMFATSASVLQFVGAGRLRALAVTTAKRSEAVADLPTVAESGYPEFEATTWHGLVAPAKTPAALIDRLAQTTREVLKEPDVQTRLSALGVEFVGDTPTEFAAYIKSETAKWAAVIHTSGIHIQ